MRRRLFAACIAATPALLGGGHALAQNTPSAPGARVYFINLTSGQTISSPFLVQFGLSGMGIAPAELDGGDLIRNTGHHHLLINATLEGDALRSGVPADDNHRHFGRGQTETTVTLPPGQYTLQLVFADWMHVPHNPPVMSERITVTVR